MTIGHQHILNYLKKSVENNRISHAYLFEGLEHLGKKTVALWFAGLLGCQYPDVTIVSVLEDKNEIGINQIRELRRYLSLSAHSSSCKVAIIDSAEMMNDEAANALLKTLEEPRGNTVLILIANIASALPETILSRCQEIKFKTVKKGEIKNYLLKKRSSQKEAEAISRLSLGKPGVAIDLFEKKISGNFKRQEFREFINFLNKSYPERCNFIENIVKRDVPLSKLLDEWINWFRDLFFTKEGIEELVVDIENHHLLKKGGNHYKKEDLIRIIKRIQKTQYFLSATNVNPRLALEVLALEF